MRGRNGKVILTLVTEDDAGDDWIDGEGWLSSFVSVRADIARGDLRALYLAWLLCVQHGDVDSGELEPPIPRGLAQLGASLEGLVEFLRIDRDLVVAAAIESAPLVNAEPQPKEIRQWAARSPRPSNTRSRVADRGRTTARSMQRQPLLRRCAASRNETCDRAAKLVRGD